MAFFLWRRKRKQQSRSLEDSEARKAELDGHGKTVLPGYQSAELIDDDDMVESRGKHHSAELSAVNDYVKWELPTTPPRKSADPIEMPAEVPLAEMNAGEAGDPLTTSENSTTMVGSTTEDGKVSPLSSQNAVKRDSLQISRRPITPNTPGAHEEGAYSTQGRLKFQEALYDIISDELRRPDAPV